MLLTTAALLLAAAANPTGAHASQHGVEPGKVIRCRKQPVTGSLARFTKECRTVDEWARLDGDNRDSATRMQDRGLVVGCGSNPTGC